MLQKIERIATSSQPTLLGLGGAEVQETKACVTVVVEAEESATVKCAQEMLFEMNVIKSIRLKVKMLIVLWINNKATVDMFNNWSVGGRTRHVHHTSFRELKEQNVLILKWIPTEKNASNIFTVNITGPVLKAPVVQYCGEDEYR